MSSERVTSSNQIETRDVDPFVLMPSTKRGVRKFVRALHHAIFHASREGRASEIVLWSNAVASLAMAGLSWFLFRSTPATIATPVVLFVLLRLALMNRHTIWIAASFGTLAVGGGSGALAWLFGHVIEVSASAPSIAAVIFAVVGAMLPAWAYGRLAERRSSNQPDSLIDPVSVPSSGQ
jgi:hypothetical protein